MLVITIKTIKERALSIKWVMVLTYFVAIAITLLLMNVYIGATISESLHDNEYVKLFSKANIVSDVCVILPETQSVSEPEKLGELISDKALRTIVVNSSCTVLYDSSKDASLIGKALIRDVINSALTGIQAEGRTKSQEDSTVLSVSVPIVSNDKIIGAVYISETVDNIDKILSDVILKMLIFSAIVCVLIGMLSVGMGFLVTSPLDQFIKAAKEISAGNYKTRIHIKGKSELHDLAEAMNTMSEALENLEDKHMKFISDVSHELKTPLASIKLISDSIVDTPDPDIGMIKEFLADLSDEVDRLTRIVERLLALSKMNTEEEQKTLTPVDFNVMILAIANRLKPNANEKNIILTTEFSEEEIPPLVIDYDKIWEAIYNISDNAIKYTPNEGNVKISLAMKSGEVYVSVSDSGVGIPAEERDKIFDRFYRIDDSRARETGGTGLGLAIAKEAVNLHGGRIEVAESEWGGSLFTIILPATADTLVSERSI